MHVGWKLMCMLARNELGGSVLFEESSRLVIGQVQPKMLNLDPVVGEVLLRFEFVAEVALELRN